MSRLCSIVAALSSAENAASEALEEAAETAVLVGARRASSNANTEDRIEVCLNVGQVVKGAGECLIRSRASRSTVLARLASLSGRVETEAGLASYRATGVAGRNIVSARDASSLTYMTCVSEENGEGR